MMQPAQQRLRDDSKADRQAMIVCTLAGRLALRIRDARSQTRMRASVVVMRDPLCEYPTDVLLVERNHPNPDTRDESCRSAARNTHSLEVPVRAS